MYNVKIRPLYPLNPIRFSSEAWDVSLGLIYYNWRHLNPPDGRFVGRDPIHDYSIRELDFFPGCLYDPNAIETTYLFSANTPLNQIDFLGLFNILCYCRLDTIFEVGDFIKDEYQNGVQCDCPNEGKVETLKNTAPCASEPFYGLYPFKSYCEKRHCTVTTIWECRKRPSGQYYWTLQSKGISSCEK